MLGAFLTPFAIAQTAAKPAERLLAADQGSALDSANAKPWHLKMDVQLFDDKGKPSDHGTIEEWWSAPGTEKQVYQSNSYSATQILKDGKLYRTDGAGWPPYYFDLLRMEVVHPMPKPEEIQAAQPEMRKVPFGKVPLECIMLSQQIKRVAFAPLGLFPTYCFDAGKDVLRASFQFGGQLVVRNAMATFGAKTVATDVSVNIDSVLVAKAEVVLLRTEQIPESEFTPEAAVKEQGPELVRVSNGIMAANLLTKPDPIYPESAKANHVSGTVIMRAVIASDGRIHLLKLVSTPDPDLAIAAIAAVRRWTYKPYVLNGMPVSVDTTITVNFEIGL
jgi:TonB family protein